MENAEAALVQGVNAIVCPFGLEKNRHREAIPQFDLSTKPDFGATCWTECLASKCTAFGFAKVEPLKPQAELLPLGLQGSLHRAKSSLLIVKTLAAGRGQARPWPACRANFTAGLGSCAHTGAGGRPWCTETTKKGPGGWGVAFLFLSSLDLLATQGWSFQAKSPAHKFL